MVTAAEIAEYDVEELETRLSETRKELFNLRFQLATGQLDNFSRLGHVRKDVARMLTELRNREIAEAEGLAFEELPAHQAAARQRSEDEAVGRTRTTAGERRAAAEAAAEAAAAEAEDAEVGDEDEDEEPIGEVEATAGSADDVVDDAASDDGISGDDASADTEEES